MELNIHFFHLKLNSNRRFTPPRRTISMKKRSGSPLIIAAALTALPAAIALAQFPQFGGGMGGGGGFGGGFGGFGGGFGGFGMGQGQQQELGDEPALRDIFKDDFLCGVALGFAQPESFTGKLAGKHFNRVVADNAMKWESVERSEGNFNWGGGDGLVRMAQQYDMQLHGHCFVWYQQTPGWVYRDLQPGEQGRATLIKRMQNHIRTRIAHDKENFHVWDVVNEAVVQDGSMRKSFWYNIVGPDYVKLAFETAREADPTAKLVYNDFDTDLAAKRDGIVRLVNEVNKDKKLVDYIGMQCHWRYTDPDMDQVERTIQAFLSTGCDILISELDIDILPRDRRNPNPYPNGVLPALVQQDLRDRYRDAYALFLKYREHIVAVTLWGLTDNGSWLDTYPFGGRRNAPLLFDRQNKPKPAFWGVVDAAAMYGRDLGDRFQYKDGIAWEKDVRTIYKPESGSVSDPYIIRLDSKRLVCVFSTDEGGGKRVIKYVFSDDDGETWSETPAQLCAVNGKDCVRPTIAQIAPAPTGMQPSPAGVVVASVFDKDGENYIYATEDQFQTWSLRAPSQRILPYPDSIFGYLNLKSGKQIHSAELAKQIGLKGDNPVAMELKGGRILISVNTDKGMSVLITKKPVTDVTKLKAADFSPASNPASAAFGTVSADTTSPRILAVGTDKEGSSIVLRRGLGMAEY